MRSLENTCHTPSEVMIHEEALYQVYVTFTYAAVTTATRPSCDVRASHESRMKVTVVESQSCRGRHCKHDVPTNRGETNYEKLRGRKMSGAKCPKKICSCPPTIPVCFHLLGTHAFLPPPSVEAMHAVTIMSLKATVVQLSVGTVC